jgi:hypothetical protein
MSICKACLLYDNGVCNKKAYGPAVKKFVYNGELREPKKMYSGCGCPLKAKTNSVKSQCPLGKW